MKTAVLILCLIICPTVRAPQTPPPQLTLEREVALAESAAPESVARFASIYVLRRGGFVLQRKGKNGFTCFVGRTYPGEIEPICYYDVESTHTLVAREFAEQALREKGMSEADVNSEIGRLYRRGELRPPQNFGLAYMLSPCNLVRDEKGQLQPEHAHLMFYAPYATNRQLGLSPPPARGHDYAPFILFEGEPWAFLIVRSETPNPAAEGLCKGE